jgi:hypothetical protein
VESESLRRFGAVPSEWIQTETDGRTKRAGFMSICSVFVTEKFGACPVRQEAYTVTNELWAKMAMTARISLHTVSPDLCGATLIGKGIPAARCGVGDAGLESASRI